GLLLRVRPARRLRERETAQDHGDDRRGGDRETRSEDRERRKTDAAWRVREARDGLVDARRRPADGKCAQDVADGAPQLDLAAARLARAEVALGDGALGLAGLIVEAG